MLRGYAVHKTLLVLLYVALYAPVLYIVYLSLNKNTIYPFPPDFTLEHYALMLGGKHFDRALGNSLILAAGTGLISTVLTGAAAWGVTQYSFRGRTLLLALFVFPLLVPTLLIGMSQLMALQTVGVPRSLLTAILGNAAYSSSFSFLIVLVQVANYDRRLDQVAAVLGASPGFRFREVTLPLIWPGLLGAFVVSFLLTFNNFDITYYNIGATPTISTATWGMLRHGISPALYALSSVIFAFTVLLILTLAWMARKGWLRL